MAKVSKDSDVHVTYEDQQKINTFARVNARLQDAKDELTSKKKELENLNEAGDELLMVEDEDAAIPYQIGEVFVMNSMEKTTKLLEDAKVATEKEMSDLETKCDEHKQVLSDLKVQLYAKFGNNINLEAEEE